MRYVVAMLFAIVVALLTTVYVSSPVASWVVSTQAFESPDEVSNLHDAVFMGVNLAGLVIGWAIGWAVGGRFGERTSA